MGHPKDNERGTTPQHRGLTPPKRLIIPKWNSRFSKPLAPRSKHPILAKEIEEKAAKEEAFDQAFILLDRSRGKGDRSHHRRALLLLADSIIKGAGSASDLKQHLKLHIQNDTPPRLFNERDAELLIRTTFENFEKTHNIQDKDFVWLWTFTLMEEYRKKVANYRQEIITEIENDALLLVRMDWNKQVRDLAREANINFAFADLFLSHYLSEKNRLEGLRLPIVDPRLFHGVQGAVSGQRLLFSTTISATIIISNPVGSLISLMGLLEADDLVGSISGNSVLTGHKLETWERVLNVSLFLIPHFKITRVVKYAGQVIRTGVKFSPETVNSAQFIAKLAYQSGEDLASVIKKGKHLGKMSVQQAARLLKAARASLSSKKPLKLTQLERTFVNELDDAVRLFTRGEKSSLKTPHKATKRPSQRSLDDISMERAFREDANFDHGSVLAKGRMKRPNSDELVPPFALLPLTRDQIAEVKRISGQRLSTGFQGAWQRIIDNNPKAQREILEIRRLFNSGQVKAAKKLGKDAYNRARTRFWRYISGAKDEQARALKSQLEAAGLRFSGSNGTAPFWQFPDGYKEILTLEHTNRVTDAPWRAVAADNFQFVPFRENVNTLEWIRGLPEFK